MRTWSPDVWDGSEIQEVRPLHSHSCRGHWVLWLLPVFLSLPSLYGLSSPAPPCASAHDAAPSQSQNNWGQVALNGNLWNCELHSQSFALLKLEASCVLIQQSEVYLRHQFLTRIVSEKQVLRAFSLGGAGAWGSPSKDPKVCFQMVGLVFLNRYNYYWTVGSKSSLLFSWFYSTTAISRMTSYMTNEFIAAEASR